MRVDDDNCRLVKGFFFAILDERPVIHRPSETDKKVTHGFKSLRYSVRDLEGLPVFKKLQQLSALVSCGRGLTTFVANNFIVSLSDSVHTWTGTRIFESSTLFR